MLVLLTLAWFAGGNLNQVRVQVRGYGYIAGEIHACEPCAPCLSDDDQGRQTDNSTSTGTNSSSGDTGAGDTTHTNSSTGSGGSAANRNASSSSARSGPATCHGTVAAGRGFLGLFDTDARGSIRRGWIVSEGLSYSAATYLELYYLGTRKKMKHTITHLRVNTEADTFFMHGCDRPGKVSMI